MRRSWPEIRRQASAALPAAALARLHVSRSPQSEHIHDPAARLLLAFISYLIRSTSTSSSPGVILSWLMAFGVVNPYNPTVRAIWQALNAVTEPLLRPIRNALPNLGRHRYLAHHPAARLLLHSGPRSASVLIPLLARRA